MSLCFDEAFDALRGNRISEEEYIHQILAHFSGARHPADSHAARTWESMVRDPVGNAIRDAALRTSDARPDYIPLLEELFLGILKDDAGASRVISSRLDSAARDSLPFQAIATFAALHGAARVLCLCLERGASLGDRNTAIALEYTARGPALLDVLYEHDWRDMRQSRLAFDRMAEWSLHTSPAELNWFLHHGAAFDQHVVRRAVRSAPIRAACVEVLIRHFGVAIFRGTGLLQSAAKRGHNDTVLTLLNAGADVDEMVPPTSRGDGELELTALYEAVYKQHLETAQILLDHGADPIREVCQGSLNTPLKLAEAHGHANLVAVLNRGLERHQAEHRTRTSRL